MVDAVNNSTTSLLRAQQVATTAATSKVAQVVINHAQKTAVVPAKITQVAQGSKANFSIKTAPRGTFVDITV